jgi:DNA sulfur modification protein DndD
MWIDYIKLKNFRQYQDEKIEFAGPENEKNFNVIKGTNGAGKTNLLNAITWCLYGKEFHLGIKNVKYPKINTLTLEKLRAGETCEVKVEIQLREKEDRIVATRTLTFKKTESGGIRKIQSFISDAPDGSELKILRRIEGKGMMSVDRIVIETTVPEVLREYFFFDGERLDDYFKEEKPKSIKEAVFKISQLEKLDDTIEHLENVKSEFRRKSKKLTPKAIDKQEELEIHEKSLKNYKKELEQLKEEWEEAKKKENEYREKLKDVDVRNIKELQEERERLEKESDELEEKIRRIKNDKSDYMIDKAPSIFVFDAISKTRQILGEKKEAGEIPPDYKKNFIEKLLKKGRCICGTDISKEGEHRKNVEKVFAECDEITNITTELSEENAILRRIQRELKSFNEESGKYNIEISELEEGIKKKDDRIKEIGLKIGGIDIERVRRWEAKRQEYESIKEEKKEDIGTHKANIKMEQKRIDKLEEEVKEELKKEKKGEALGRKLDFCDKALEVAENVKKEIMENIRKEIEKKTEEQFLELIWKEKNYKKVIIDDEYNVSPIDQKGRNALGALGAGERQALALSFMAALNNVSGFKAPIVIDTPLARIDEGKPKWQIAESLPNYLKGRQVIMLVTGSEYTPKVRERLLKRTGKEYKIKFEETDIGNRAWVVPYEDP